MTVAVGYTDIIMQLLPGAAACGYPEKQLAMGL